MKLIRHKKTAEINSPHIHQRVLRSIHQVSKEEIARAMTAINVISAELNTKKQEKQTIDSVPIYLVF